MVHQYPQWWQLILTCFSSFVFFFVSFDGFGQCFIHIHQDTISSNDWQEWARCGVIEIVNSSCVGKWIFCANSANYDACWYACSLVNILGADNFCQVFSMQDKVTIWTAVTIPMSTNYITRTLSFILFREVQYITKQHSAQSVGNMPPPSPQHLLPHVLQIMPRNPKYDQFHPKGHHNEENLQSTTILPGNPKFYPFHWVKIASKLEKFTSCNHNLISSASDQDTSECKIAGHFLNGFSRKCLETPNLTRFIKSK